MAASASISVDPATIQIQAGGRASARVTVLNQGDTVGQYSLDVSGVDPTWIKLDPQQMGIFPGDRAIAQLNLRTPENSVSATYKVVIRAANQVDPADTALAALSLTVQSVGLADNATVVSPRQVPAPEQGTVRRSPAAQAQKPVTQPPVSNPAPGPAQVVLQAASPSGQLQLTADQDSLRIPPGHGQPIQLGLSNSGGVAINLELQAKGPPENWLVFTPGKSLNLGPGETSAASLTITIPAQAPLGFYPLSILAQGVDDPALAARFNLILEVIKQGDVSIQLDPPQVEGEMTGQFTVLLSQTGLAPLTVGLSGSDDSGWLDYVFSPPNVTLPPGGKTSSRLSVQARQSLTGGEARYCILRGIRLVGRRGYGGGHCPGSPAANPAFAWRSARAA